MRDRLCGEDINERASRIRAAVSRIVRLIDSLVDTSRVMDGDANLFFHPEPIDLASVLRDAYRLHREISPGAQILEDYGSQPLPICGDPKLLFQAFDNLLSNAIKYSPAGAKVGLRGRQAAGVTSVVVKDHGIGIPEQDRAQIFTWYYRGGNVSGFVGTGVGLFLVATVVHLHGGEIEVKSSEGKGSRFTVTLPSGQPATPARSARPIPREGLPTCLAGDSQCLVLPHSAFSLAVEGQSPSPAWMPLSAESQQHMSNAPCAPSHRPPRRSLRVANGCRFGLVCPHTTNAGGRRCP